MKRNEHIVSLSRDHHFGLLFAWKIKRGLERQVDLKRIKKYVAFFWETDLKHHFEAEEKFLFILKDDASTQIAQAEHTLIRGLVTAIVMARDEDPSDYLGLTTMIEQHIRFEERTLFPHLEQLLSPEQLTLIGTQLGSAGMVHKDDYDDQYWLNK